MLQLKHLGREQLIETARPTAQYLNFNMFMVFRYIIVVVWQLERKLCVPLEVVECSYPTAETGYLSKMKRYQQSHV